METETAMIVRLTPELKRALVTLAELQDRSQAGVLRALIREAAARDLVLKPVSVAEKEVETA